jgi:hypothetical protein
MGLKLGISLSKMVKTITLVPLTPKHVYDDDVDQPRNTSKDPFHVPNGPMTRSKTKAFKEALNALVLNVSTKSELKGPLEYQRGDPSTSYPCARGVQHNLIWAMR